MDENPDNLYRFEKFVVIYNPASTNAKRSRDRINDLKKLFPSREIDIIETSPDGDEANRKLFAGISSKLDDKTLLCIASGDGTVNAVLDSLLNGKGKKTNLPKVTILPFWGGNANDLAHMTNGPSFRISTKKIFEKGTVQPVYPIKFKLVSGNKTFSKIAACYASFGASAFANLNLETPQRRTRRIYKVPGSRLVSEVSIVLYSFVKATTYTEEINGQKDDVYEHAFINGSRLAKVGVLPIKLNTRSFYEIVFNRKHPVIILNILKALRNRNFGRAVQGEVAFTIKSETPAQFDGEMMNIKPNTKVTASLSPAPFYVLTTKLSGVTDV